MPSLGLRACEPAVDAEHAGDREAPDVGVEHADGEARGGERGGEVDGDRRLPTPPLPDAMASTRVVAGISVSGACSRAFQRALQHDRRCVSSAVISPQSTLHVGDAGERARPGTRRRFLIWARSGQPAVVSATVMHDAVRRARPSTSAPCRGRRCCRPARGRSRRGAAPYDRRSAAGGRRGVTAAILPVVGRVILPLWPTDAGAPPRRPEGAGRQHALRDLPGAGPLARAARHRRDRRARSACTPTPCGPTSSACARSACSTSRTEAAVGRRPAPAPLLAGRRRARRSGSSRRRSRCWPACCCAWPPRPALGPTTPPSRPRAGPGRRAAPPDAAVVPRGARRPSSTGSASTRPSTAPTTASAPSIAFAHCPFRELAEAYPELVCTLHRGLVEGFVEAVGRRRGRRLPHPRPPRPLPGDASLRSLHPMQHSGGPP